MVSNIAQAVIAEAAACRRRSPTSPAEGCGAHQPAISVSGPHSRQRSGQEKSTPPVTRPWASFEMISFKFGLEHIGLRNRVVRKRISIATILTRPAMIYIPRSGANLDRSADAVPDGALNGGRQK